jgi:hypothetical protein
MALICKALFLSISTFETPPTQSVDAGGRSLRMDNSRGDCTFMKGMRQGLWQKKSDKQTSQTKLTSRCVRNIRS